MNYKYSTNQNNTAIFRVWCRTSPFIRSVQMDVYNAWKNGLISLIVDEDAVKRELEFKAYMRGEI